MPVCSLYIQKLEGIGIFRWCTLIHDHTTFAKRLVPVKEARTYVPRHQQHHQIDRSNTSKVQHTCQSVPLTTGMLVGVETVWNVSRWAFPEMLSPSSLHHSNSWCAQARWQSRSKNLQIWRGNSALSWHQDLLACPEQPAKPADSYSLPLLSFRHATELNWPVLIAPLVKAFCLPIFDTCLLNGDNSTKSTSPALINSCLWSILKIQGDLPLLLLL